MTKGEISVIAEGNTIIKNLASHAFSGNDNSFSVVRTVKVEDGELNINYSSPVAKLAILLKKSEASSSPTDNDPPLAKLVQSSDASYLDGDDITLVAEVSDSDGKVTQASFWVDGNKINEQNVSTASGYVSYIWKSVSTGKYEVQVKVKDNDGTTSSSAKVTYEVGNPDGPASSPEDPETPDSPVAEAGEPGLHYAYYVGDWKALPDFSQLQPVDKGVVPNFTFAPAQNLYTMGFEYTGYLLIEQAGTYTFHVKVNDGSNLYIDGKEIVNNDGLKPEAREKSGSVALSVGYHPIRLTFFEQWGPQSLEVRYEGPGVKLQLIPDNVLFLDAPEDQPEPVNEAPIVNAGQDIEITLPKNEITLKASASDQDGEISSYQWKKISGPAAAIAVSEAKETKVANLVAGTYQFVITVQDDKEAKASDTVKVTVKEAPIVDEGDPRLYYTYFEGEWSKLPDFAQLKAVKKGTVSNFDLSLRQQKDNFGFMYEGYIDITTAGAYQFYTSSDDGSALYIDGQRVVNNDGPHGKREESGKITLAKGKHPIKVVYFERAGSEVLEVSYQGPDIKKMRIPSEVLSLEGEPSSTPEAPISEAGEPGLHYAYYVGDWKALPDFSQLQPVDEGVVPNFTFAPAQNLYTMGFEYTGYLLIEQAGTYTFHVKVNDGSNLYIDGKEIVNNDGLKPEAREKSGSVALSVGYHPIRLTFFEQWGPQSLEVRYEGPGVKLQLIPDNVLFLDAPQNNPLEDSELIYVNVQQGKEKAAAGWNNLQSTPVTGKQWNLQNANGESANITLKLETDWDGANDKGFISGDSQGKFPDAVTQTYYWTKETEAISLSGLSSDKLYSFTFYASSMFGGDRTTIYQIADQEVRLDASYNEHNTVTIENVRPAADGKIVIEVSRAAGSSYGFLGALIIESKKSEAPSVKREVIQQEDVVLATEPEVEVIRTIHTNVYPNPTIGMVNIETSEDATYMVSDLQGNNIKEDMISANEKATLDLSSFPRGIYLVKIRTASEWATHKVIVQ
uniref:PA14 domain-containing protein n=1 Tax=Roseihalotalea indica TaxID=2867963 RepID=A0AA49JJ31_9BACT|nr:PA14 domain-containing protein [Tunicatimonas sp. TK19036]